MDPRAKQYLYNLCRANNNNKTLETLRKTD
jgi:hypothetical protein